MHRCRKFFVLRLISLRRWPQEGVNVPIYDVELAAMAAWFVVIEWRLHMFSRLDRAANGSPYRRKDAWAKIRTGQTH